MLLSQTTLTMLLSQTTLTMLLSQTTLTMLLSQTILTNASISNNLNKCANDWIWFGWVRLGKVRLDLATTTTTTATTTYYLTFTTLGTFWVEIFATKEKKQQKQKQ